MGLASMHSNFLSRSVHRSPPAHDDGAVFSCDSDADATRLAACYKILLTATAKLPSRAQKECDWWDGRNVYGQHSHKKISELKQHVVGFRCLRISSNHDYHKANTKSSLGLKIELGPSFLVIKWRYRHCFLLKCLWLIMDIWIIWVS